MVSYGIHPKRCSTDTMRFHQYMVGTPVVVARRDQPKCDSDKCECDFNDEQLGVEL